MGLDATLVQNGRAAEIKSRARQFIEEAGRDGRLILYMNDIPSVSSIVPLHFAFHCGSKRMVSIQ